VKRRIDVFNSHRLFGEPMAAKGNSKIDTLTALPGIGAATAKKLMSAKIDSVSKVASAGSKKLQDAGLSAAVAKKVSAAAKAADKASSAAKKTASKAKTATRSTAKKSASVVKKAASKSKSAAKKATSAAKSVSKKAATKTKSAAKKVSEKAIKGKDKVKSSDSGDGRKGSTLRIPRSVTDMPWFKKK
tara:strand:- start:456 stop:1019 length:564 start_codon:yes stop_codon:yes gene_type:complete